MSKDQNGSLKSFRKQYFKLNRSSILVVSILILILFIAFTVRIFPMRWEIPTGQIHLNEFDPYYQYSITNYMVNNGLLSPYTNHWVNYQQWYPHGLDMSQSLSALPMTAAALYQAVSFLGISVDLMAFCAVLTVALGTLSCLVLYFIGKDMGGRAVGLFAALALALAPTFIQRSSLGFFDTEIPGMIGLLFFILFFLRSIDSKRSFRSGLVYSVGAALALAYFITGWGAAYYILDLAALFIFVLVVLKRSDRRLLINYGITMGLGLLIAVQLPYIGLSYLTSIPMIPVIAVFILLLFNEFTRHGISAKNRLFIITAVTAIAIIGLVALTYTGYIGEMAGKFTSVINPSTRATTPLIASVSEHRVTGWGNLYMELGVGAIFFLVGLYFVLKNPTNRNIFLLLFGITGLYFGASMIRLLVIFAPAFGLLMAMGIIGMLKPFMTMLKETPNTAMKAKRKLFRVSKEYSGLGILLLLILVMTQFAVTPRQDVDGVTRIMPRVYISAYAPTSINSAALPIVPNEPLTQWLDMLDWTSRNLKPTDVVVAWWDYGYWLSTMGNVTTLADNATINGTQIENLAFAYMASEELSLKMLSTYGQENVQYILVFVDLIVGQDASGEYHSEQWRFGDEGKWVWAADISGGAKDRLIQQGFMDPNNAWSNRTNFGGYDEYYNVWMWNALGENSVIYKLLADIEQQFAANTQGLVTPSSSEVTLDYLKPVHISGIDISSLNPQGTLVPLVGLYEINWAAYNADHP